MNLTQSFDQMGVSSDFRKRKSFLYYDPYNEEANDSNSSMLRYAADDDLERASVVVNQFSEQFAKLNEESDTVNFIEQERMKQIGLLLHRLD